MALSTVTKVCVLTQGVGYAQASVGVRVYIWGTKDGDHYPRQRERSLDVLKWAIKWASQVWRSFDAPEVAIV